MTSNEDRYKNFMDVLLQALSDDDVDAWEAGWADDCTHQEIDPFDEGPYLRGRAAMRKLGESYVGKGFRVLKNEMLSSDAERGIGNARVTWTGTDGRQRACDFIYRITLDADDRCTSYEEWNVVRAKDEG